jgi:arsenate reductase-like glutaredoxin family protein
MSCKRAQGFLAAQNLEVKDQSDAGKERRGRKEALELARSVEKIVVGKGMKVVTFDMKADPPDDETLLSHLLGPTGNLRAPTLRRGRTLLVGFSEEAYREVLGKNDK